MEDLFLGIDIGGTKTAVVVGNRQCDVLERSVIDMGGKTVAEVLQFIVSSCKEYQKTYPAIAVGVSCGGPLDSAKGVILSPPNLPGWDRIEIVSLLRQTLCLPAFLQNDADACALAEWRFGSGRGSKNMIFLTFGTGMGAGLILNGALYSGTSNSAGEVGHIRLEDDGPIGYGKAGSFEGFCSGGGIRQQMQNLQNTGVIPPYVELSAKALAQHSAAGNEWALSLWRDIARNLGRGISILVDILNPEVIVIGSIFTRAELFLREELERVIEAEALTINKAHCRILPSSLGDAIGDAAALTVAMNGVDTQ